MFLTIFLGINACSQILSNIVNQDLNQKRQISNSVLGFCIILFNIYSLNKLKKSDERSNSIVLYLGLVFGFSPILYSEINSKCQSSTSVFLSGLILGYSFLSYESNSKWILVTLITLSSKVHQEFFVAQIQGDKISPCPLG